MTSAQGAAAVSMPIARYRAPAYTDMRTGHMHAKDSLAQCLCTGELHPSG